MRSFVIGVVAALSVSGPSIADTYVSGYTTANGTYVQGYNRTDSNSTRNDNYSTRGNTNPYTGQPGTKPRDGETTAGPTTGTGYGSTTGQSNRGRVRF